MTRTDIARQIQIIADDAYLDAKECYILVLANTAFKYGNERYKGNRKEIEKTAHEIALDMADLEKTEDVVYLISHPWKAMILAQFMFSEEMKELAMLIVRIFTLATQYKAIALLAKQVAKGINVFDKLERKINNIGDMQYYRLSAQIREHIKKHPEQLSLKDFEAIAKHDKIIDALEQLTRQLKIMPHSAENN
jgi:ABC-type cobalamin transport system ATPase subunit